MLPNTGSIVQSRLLYICRSLIESDW